MSLPFSGPNNVGGFKILPSEINLVTALGSGGADNSDTFNVLGGSVYLAMALASGQCTVTLKVDAVTPVNPASGGTSVTLVGGSAVGLIQLDSSASNIYGAVRIVDANWSSAFSKFDLMVLREFPRKFGWFNTDSAENGGGLVDHNPLR